MSNPGAYGVLKKSLASCPNLAFDLAYPIDASLSFHLQACSSIISHKHFDQGSELLHIQWVWQELKQWTRRSVSQVFGN